MTDYSRAMSSCLVWPANTFNGFFVLVVLLAFAALFVWHVLHPPGFYAPGSAKALFAAEAIGLVLLFVLTAAGFYMIQPNQGVVITLFGAYRGTDRKTGLHWMWPWMGKKKLS